MQYTITDRGVVYTVEPPADLPEITTAQAVAVCERILAEHEAIFPTDDQKARIKARIMSQCECAALGVKPCGMCEG